MLQSQLLSETYPGNGLAGGLEAGGWRLGRKPP